MDEQRKTKRELIHAEMFAYLEDLHARTDKLLTQRDAFNVYNSVQHLRSLVGQLDSAARRYREEA